MMALRSIISDPMLRMLALAIAVAALLPATGVARGVVQVAANIGIFALFLLNGMRIRRSAIAAGAANLRFLLPLTLWVFGGMTLVGLGLSRMAPVAVPPIVAAGFLYLGVLPTTIQSSTSYSSLARGNVALSILSAALLSLIGVFLSAPLFLALAGAGEGVVGSDAVLKIVGILIVPFAIGQFVQNRTQEFIAIYKPRIAMLDRLVIALAVYVAFSSAVEQDVWTRIDSTGWLWTGILVLAFLVIGHVGAWLASATLRLPATDRIAFLFAGAQKSAAIGAPLATVLFVPEVAGFIVLPLLLYHFFQLVLAAPMASYLAGSVRHHASGYDGRTTRS